MYRRIYLLKGMGSNNNRKKMSTCNRLDLEWHGSWPTMHAQKLSFPGTVRSSAKKGCLYMLTSLGNEWVHDTYVPNWYTHDVLKFCSGGSVFDRMDYSRNNLWGAKILLHLHYEFANFMCRNPDSKLQKLKFTQSDPARGAISSSK